MPIKYPDFLQNNNPNEVLIDATENQIKGFGFFANTTERDNLSSSLQTSGFVAVVAGTVYVFTGSTWTSASDWTALGSGGDVVDDTTPQLGGDLDTNGNNITAASSFAIQTNSNNSAVFNASVELYESGNKKLETTTDGVSVLGFVQLEQQGSPPTASDGAIYADASGNLYFGAT